MTRRYQTTPRPGTLRALPTSRVPPTDGDPVRAAWRADLRQDLLAPADGIIELADMLLHDARQQERDDLAADVARVRAAGESLRKLIEGLLEPPESEAQRRELERLIRHDICNCLNPIIGYCEQWLEDAADLLLDTFIPDLQKTHALGKQVAIGLDKLLQASKAASAPDSGPPEPMPAPSPLPEGGPLRSAVRGAILVVDDNDVNRDLIGSWMRRDGHTVAEARDGREALAALRTRPFDLVLLDVRMPEVNGFEVLEALKADPGLRRLPVIMISAFSDIDAVVRCIQQGADDYLPKPFNPVLLRARVHACLEKKRLLEEIDRERRRADELLHVILPTPVVAELKATNRVKPCRHENVAVLFCDVAGFTPYCDRHEPEEVIAHLQGLVEAWEDSAVRHGVQKIKTSGDAFMAAAGLPGTDTDSPVRACVELGQDMIRLTHELTPWDIRVGINAGPVVGAILGRRQYLFDLWGDTVNTAQRMESHGLVGAITLSEAAWSQVVHCARGVPRGRVEVKGKGPLEMFRFDGFLAPRDGST